MGKQCQTLFFGAPRSLQMVTAAMKLKDVYSLVSQSSGEWGDGGGSKAGLGKKLIVGHCICKEPAFRVPRKKVSLVTNFVW